MSSRKIVLSSSSSMELKAGSLVWGKSVGYAWWPGVVASRRIGYGYDKPVYFKIIFFGDGLYDWVDQWSVVPFEPNFIEMSNQMREEKFRKAVDEAVYELSRRVALAFLCRCRSSMKLMVLGVYTNNYTTLDVIKRHEKNGEQVVTEREWVDTRKILGFVKKAAVCTSSEIVKDADWYRFAAACGTLRKILFAEMDKDDIHYSGKRKCDNHYDDGQPSSTRRSTRLFAPPICPPPSARGGGKKPVEERMQSQRMSRKQIEIPSAKVGLIIGTSRETMNRLRTESQAMIQLEKDAGASQTRYVTILGTREQVSRAEELINALLSEADSKVNFSIKVPSDKVGLLIGRKGENVKAMQVESGAHINLAPIRPPASQTSDRTFQLYGTSDQISAAVLLIQTLVARHN